MQDFESFRSPFLVLCLASLILLPSILMAGDIQTDGKLISTATSGPPLEVASTERVASLNADRLDGLEASDLYTQAEVDALIANLESQIDDLLGGTLLVMDDQNVVVGEVVDTLKPKKDVLVLLREGNHRVVATVTKSSLRTSPVISYLLADCAGQEYIDPMVIGPDGTTIHQEFQAASYAFAEGYVLFRAPPSEVPVQLLTASTWDTNLGCQPTVNNIDLVLAEEITTLAFTPPFRIVDQGSP